MARGHGPASGPLTLGYAVRVSVRETDPALDLHAHDMVAGVGVPGVPTGSADQHVGVRVPTRSSVP
jgi:hypothetical protein